MESAFPVVSIILATYNGGKYLAEQIESVMAQSYANIEIIIVDDCSTDNTIEIVKSFQGKYPAIKLLQNETNLGYIKNFEKGCVVAGGDLIAFCDQDDYWHRDKIKNMQAAIGNYPVIYCDSVLCDEHLKPLGVNISDRVNCFDVDNCLEQAVIGRIYGHATLIKKSFLQHCIPFLTVIPHDWWLCYNATLNGGIKYLSEVLVSYRQHATNVFGAVGGKSRKTSKANRAEIKRIEQGYIRTRIVSFYNACPAALVNEKEVLRKLVSSYQSFSLINNFQRMVLFFRYQDQLLSRKKRSLFRKYLFCLKMFVQII